MHRLLTASVQLREPVHRHHTHTHVALAVLFALLSAVAFAVAMVAQQRAAAQVPDEQSHGQLFTHLLRSPQWLAGTAGSLAGYLLQAVALGFGSVLIVAPLLVTSLLFALPWGARLAHRTLPTAVWVWGFVLAISLAVFVTTGNPNNGSSHGTRHDWIIAAVVSGPVVFSNYVVSEYYWTSSTDAADPSRAWALYSCDFGVYVVAKTELRYTLAVR